MTAVTWIDTYVIRDRGEAWYPSSNGPELQHYLLHTPRDEFGFYKLRLPEAAFAQLEALRRHSRKERVALGSSFYERIPTFPTNITRDNVDKASGALLEGLNVAICDPSREGAPAEAKAWVVERVRKSLLPFVAFRRMLDNEEVTPEACYHFLRTMESWLLEIDHDCTWEVLETMLKCHPAPVV